MSDLDHLLADAADRLARADLKPNRQEYDAMVTVVDRLLDERADAVRKVPA